MSETNRRKFLAVAGTGAAAGVVGVAAGPAFAGSTSAGPTTAKGAAKQTVVAYIDDHRGDELVLLVGEREVVVQDRALVARILDAAGGE